VKERIRQIVTAQKVEALANQKAEAIAAALARGRTLEEAARGEGLAVRKSPPLAAGEVKDPLGSPLLMARAFELRPGEVGKEAFSLPRGTAFISLAEVQPSRLPELKEVQERVRADLVEEKALDKALALALEVRSRADKVGLEKAASALGLLRKETPSLTSRGQPFGDLGSGAALDEAAFALPEKTLSDPVRVATGYAVLRVVEKKPFDAVAFEQQKAAVMASLRQEKRNELFQDYVNMLRRRFAVERNTEAFKRVVGQG
jgi:peptidyl-prolyl cis-trans isomerase D